MLHQLQSPPFVAIIKMPICGESFIKIGLMCAVKEYDFTLRYSTFLHIWHVFLVAREYWIREQCQ